MDTYTVLTAAGGGEALKIFNEKDIALVITDQRMPEMEGTELLARINEAKPACKKILLTGYADINAAVDAINMGSVDKYFSKRQGWPGKSALRGCLSTRPKCLAAEIILKADDIILAEVEIEIDEEEAQLMRIWVSTALLCDKLGKSKQSIYGLRKSIEEDGIVMTKGKRPVYVAFTDDFEHGEDMLVLPTIAVEDLLKSYPKDEQHLYDPLEAPDFEDLYPPF